MARVYLITEEEMNALLDSLKLKALEDHNYLRHNDLTPEEKNRLSGVHGAFHMVCVRWAQAVGFKGYRS